MSKTIINMLRARNISLWLGALAFEAGGVCQNYVPIIVVPRSPGNPAHQTFVESINNQGGIAGYYTFGSGLTPHGFVRAANGTITTFDYPRVPTFGTFVFSINAAGAITGYYVGGTFPFTNHGFVRDPEGNFTSFDPPGSTSTIAQSINARGAITGYYNASNLLIHGFVRQPDGTIVTFDPPDSTSTKAVGINALGTIAGDYQLANMSVHGFVRQPDGTIETFDPPGSTGTTVTGISAGGVITGSYTSGGRTFGFVRDIAKAVVTFTAGFSTFPTGINVDGAITGSFSTDTGSGHNFVRLPSGSIFPFDPPSPPPNGFFCSGSGFRTSINDNGLITGWCFTGAPDPSILTFVRYP
jgi:hypothetical protein